MPKISFVFDTDTRKGRRDLARFEKSLKGVGTTADLQSKKTVSGFKSISGSLQGAAIGLAAVTAATTAVFAGFKRIANTQDQIAKLSKRFGVGVKELSAYRLATQLTGTSIESLATGIRTLSKNVLDVSRGTGEAKQSFIELGIQVTNADGSLKGANSILLEVAGRFSRMSDATRKAGLAAQIFGRAGSELIPLLNQGSAGIQEMTDRARELGLVFDKQAAAKAELFNDSLTELSSAGEGLAFSLSQSLFPALTFTSKGLTSWLTLVTDLARAEWKELKDGVQNLQDFARSLPPAVRVLAGLSGIVDLQLGGDADLNSKREALALYERLNAEIVNGAELEAAKLRKLEAAKSAAAIQFENILQKGRDTKDTVDSTAVSARHLAQIESMMAKTAERKLATQNRFLQLIRDEQDLKMFGFLSRPQAPSEEVAQTSLGPGLEPTTTPRERVLGAMGAENKAALMGSFDPQPVLAGLDALGDAAEPKVNRIQEIFGVLGGVGTFAFHQMARGIKAGGPKAAGAFAQMAATVLQSMAPLFASQGSAEVVMGSAPPPFTRPDLAAHGGVMLTVAAALGAAGGVLGGLSGGGGKGGIPQSVNPFTGVSAGSSVQPNAVDASGGGNAVQSGGGASPFDSVVAVVTALEAKISSMPAGHVVTLAARNRRLIPSLASGEVPA